MPRKQTSLRGPKDREPSQKLKSKRKTGRSLNALAIAEKEFPEKIKIRRNRLGEVEEESDRKRKPGRDEDDDDSHENKRRRTDDGDSDFGENVGSDDEGREWRLGEVDSDNDSELDSDEAMGSSDEERFEGFTFRGSSTMKSQPSRKPSGKAHGRREIDLSEDVDHAEEADTEEDDEDDLGSDAVDLTTAWDMNVAEEEAERAAATAASKKETSNSDIVSGSETDSDDDEESEEVSDDSELSVSEDDLDDVDDHGLAKLQSFVNSMNPEPASKPSRTPNRGQERATPTEYGLSASRKLTVADLLPSITDSRLKSSLKHIDAAASTRKSTSGIPGKLDAPLPKRQQDRLDRAAAYEKSKETLDRWIETVKANRRAEHLSFPLPDPDVPQTKSIGAVQPQTDLETTIQTILAESGLADASGKSAEEQVQQFEELQARKLPLEEIRARRAELRKRRDLLFREEVRAKRIKKIKSKSYRRVHRKEREKLEQQERQALIEGGVDLDEEERERNERRRAEARMGAKHKDSKWAKSLKQTGRTAWDEEARNNAASLALREEELRKRIEGKSVSRGDDSYLDSSSSESDDEDPWQEDNSDNEKRKLRKKLEALENDGDEDDEAHGPHAKLLSMKFMKNAEASRKAENDAEIRKLNREFRGEESQSEAEAESEVGRRKFGHSEAKLDAAKQAKRPPRNEFEEAPGSEDDNDDVSPNQDIDIIVNGSGRASSKSRPDKATAATKAGAGPASNTVTDEGEEENPWLVQTNRTNRRPKADLAGDTVDISLDKPQQSNGGHKVASMPSSPAQDVAPKKPKKQQYSDHAVPEQRSLADEDDSGEDNVPVLLKNHDLVKRAFAGDEVVQDFEQEKLDTIEDEGDKVIDNTLPGWGSWTGDGISKKQQKRQKRFLTTVEGVKPENRKDAKLAKVIINEKRVKKNVKYMATQLPHPFETRQQYERSLRLPIGPEWSTKETLQDATKPRVMVKQGIIKPMEKPLL